MLSSYGESLFHGVACATFGSYEKAIENFDDVLEKNPNCARAWLGKGDALGGLKRYEEAIMCIDKALELGLSKTKEAEAWYRKGLALFYLNRREEATSCFDNSLKIDQGNIGALHMKGTCYFSAEKYKEALDYYNEVLETLRINPDSDAAKRAKEGKEAMEYKLREQAKSKLTEEHPKGKDILQIFLELFLFSLKMFFEMLKLSFELLEKLSMKR